MAKVTPISEHFQHFLAEMKDSFWGDLYGKTGVAWKEFFDGESLRQRDRWIDLDPYQRDEQRRDSRNGFYERDFGDCWERSG